MGKFKVDLIKEQQLLQTMATLGIREEDIVERFIRGSGKGGQKRNKTSSCVHLHHPPSGIEIRCQSSRYQSLNRFLARRELCNRLDERISGDKSRKQQLIEKIRRQKARRTRKQKERILEQKRMTSQKKVLRKTVQTDD